MRAVTRWIVTADARRAALYECRPNQAGQWRLRRTHCLETPPEPEHEHHRPSVLGRGPSASPRQRYASHGHEHEEAQRRFARQVRNWLARARREIAAEPAAVFAAPRFLGHLRDELGRAGAAALLRERELTTLPPEVLAQHPAVVQALAANGVAHPRSRR